jgi:hypothetical protein
MKKIYFIRLVGFLLVSCFIVVACDNGTNSDVKTIALKYRGKWEINSFKLADDPTIYTIPCTVTIQGISANVNSGGYEVGDTFVKTYVNDILMQDIRDLFSYGDFIFNSSGPIGVTVKVNGINATVTTAMEIDYCTKVTKFSWE